MNKIYERARSLPRERRDRRYPCKKISLVMEHCQLPLFPPRFRHERSAKPIASERANGYGLGFTVNEVIEMTQR